ncbi:MAG TPA: nucleoside transporter C-terminal domain-containing protein, partial [Gemmataceae bacterium]|nr:nucleoside transporter C-terminal domain-containing protein [Gemmataceae bacterium]
VHSMTGQRGDRVRNRPPRRVIPLTRMPDNAPSGTPPLWRVLILAGVAAVTAGAWLVRESIGVRGQAVVGVFCFLGVAAAFSADLRGVNWRTVATGLGLQFLLAVLILRVEFVYQGFEALGFAVSKFLDFANKGADFVFGPLADHGLSEKAFGKNLGYIFAVRALPAVIFVSAVFTVLYHLRVLQGVVWVFARAMVFVFGRRGVSGAEALAATANVFMGQTEAPLIIKPYVASMTKSELLALMIGGMATIAGGVMAAYIGMGADPVAILATSVMAAPTGLYLSKLLLPETEEPVTRGQVRMADERKHANVIDAAAGGASDGMMLVINIIAMLIAFIAGIALVNYLLGLVGPVIRVPDLSLEWLFSKLFAPVAFLTGVPWDDAPRVGELLGKKLVLNEFVAFKDLTDVNSVKKDDRFVGVQGMQERSYRLAVFALTGFANFSSIGIQLGGIGAMAPSRRSDLARLGLRALLGGFLATLINAAIAGILLG